jgi:predicted nucleic acid-binding protein
MTIIVDANMAIAVAMPMNYTAQATQLMRRWKAAQERLLAPVLFEYEVITAFRRAIALKMLIYSEALEGLDIILSLGIELVFPSRTLDMQALSLAERIDQSKAYDAQYLALAARENAPFWTADRRLAAAAHKAGLNWVFWVGDWQASDG